MCSWDTRQMFFGAGTKLIVEAQSQPISKPSVFVMKNNRHFACLVKDFYPKAIKVKFYPDIKHFDTAIAVNSKGKYSAVKIGHSEDKTSVICSVEHNGEIIYSTEFDTDSSGPLKPTKSTHKEPSPEPANMQKTPEPANMQKTPEPANMQKTPEPANMQKTPEPANMQKTPESKNEGEQMSGGHDKPKATVYPEKVNMMSLTVLGLRMWFAKSVAINVFLTAKLFFF